MALKNKTPVLHPKPALLMQRLFSVTFKRFSRLRGIAVVALMTMTLSVLYLSFVTPPKAYATTNATLNFQARLESSSGAIAPDGTYNIEFKLYSASSGGSAEWTEDYLLSASNGVKVANGYLTVNLGSITAFPNTINWGTPQYLTMNIGSTASCSPFSSCSPDGEMSPRLPLTAVPAAFSLESNINASGYNSNLTLTQPGSGVTTGNENFVVQDQGAAGTYSLLTGGSISGATAGVVLQSGTPGTVQTGNFNVSGTGVVGTALQTPLVNTANGTTSATLTIESGNASAGAAGNVLIDTGTFTSGTPTVEIGYTHASDVFIGNIGTTGEISIDVGTSGNILVGTSGNNKTISVGAVGSTANTTTVHIADTTGNAAQTVTIGGNGNSGSTTKLQAGATSESLANSGDTIQTTTNSTTAFQIQNASSSQVLDINTTQSSLVANPNFESGTTNWSASPGTNGNAIAQNTTSSNVYYGNDSLAITLATTGTSGATTSTYTSTLSAGTYTLSFMAKGSAAISGLSASLGSGTCTLSGTTVSTNYSFYFCSGVVTTGSPVITISATTNNQTLYIDGVELDSGSSVVPFRPGSTSIEGDLVVNGNQLQAANSAYALTVNVPMNSQNFAAGGGIIIQGNSNNIYQKDFAIVTSTGSNLMSANTTENTITIKGGSTYFNVPALTVSSTDTGEPGILITGASGQTGNIFQVTDYNSNSLLKVGADGATQVKTPVTNDTNAFQVANSNGVAALNVDTTAGGMSLSTNIGRINVNGIADPTTPTLSTATSGGSLPTATTYYYEVAAIGQAGVYTAAEAPSPAFVTTGAGSSNLNTFSWTAVTNATGYIIYRSNNGTTWNNITVSASTLAIADNGTTYNWATNGTAPNPQTWNGTGGIGLQQDTALVLDGGTGNYGAQLSYSSVFKDVILGDYNSGGGVMLQGNSFTFEDSSGYNNDLQIANTGATTFQNRTNSGNAFQIETAGGTPITVLNVDTNNDKVTINGGSLPLTLNVSTNTNEDGIMFQLGGTNKGEIGIAGSAAQIIGTTSPGDLALKASNGNILFSASTSNSSNEQMRLTQNGYLGIGTGSSVGNRLQVAWVSGDTAATSYFGANNASNNQIAVEGQSYSNTGIEGLSNSSMGIYGYSNTYAGVFGQSQSGESGIFQSNSNSNASATLVTQQQGTGTADLFEAQNAAGTGVLFNVTSSGYVGVGTANSSSTGTALTVSGAAQQTGFATSNTSSGTNYWTELGSCTLGAQYSQCYTSFNVISGSDGNGNYTLGTVTARVKQQGALGATGSGSLYIELQLGTNLEFINSSNLKAVITQYTGAGTIVQLWGDIGQQYDQWQVAPTVNASTQWVWTPVSGLSSTYPAGQTTGLPTGFSTPIIGAIYGDADANSLLVQSASNSATAVQIQNNSGYNIFTADTSSNDQVILGTSNHVNGTLAFADSGDSNYIKLATNSSGTLNLTVPGSATTTTFGSTSTTGTTDTDNNMLFACSQFTATASGTVSSITVNFQDVTNGTYKLGQAAIYSDSSGTAGSELGKSNSVTLVAGQNTFNLTTNPSVAAGTLYWLCASSNLPSGSSYYNTNNLVYNGGGEEDDYTMTTYGTWPATMGAYTFTSSNTYDIYATVNATGASTTTMSITSNGSTVFQSAVNSSTAFQVNNAAGTSLLNVNSNANTVTILQNAEAYTAVGGACGTNSNFEVADNIASPTNSVRWRTNTCGANLESGGVDMYLSGWTGANFTGTQQFFLRGYIGTAGNSYADTGLFVGNAAASSTPMLLVLANKNTTGDPAFEFDGGMYYNSATESFMCGQHGSWSDCTGLVQATTTTSAGEGGNTSEHAFGQTWTIPQNDCAAGVVYHIIASGYADSGTAGYALTFNIQDTNVATSAVQDIASGTPHNGTDSEWEVDALITCRGSNQVMVSGQAYDQWAGGSTGTSNFGPITGADETPATLYNDANGDKIGLSIQWGTNNSSEAYETQFTVQRLGGS